jgi:hypothetical protein
LAFLILLSGKFILPPLVVLLLLSPLPFLLFFVVAPALFRCLPLLFLLLALPFVGPLALFAFVAVQFALAFLGSAPLFFHLSLLPIVIGPQGWGQGNHHSGNQRGIKQNSAGGG